MEELNEALRHLLRADEMLLAAGETLIRAQVAQPIASLTERLDRVRLARPH